MAVLTEEVNVGPFQAGQPEGERWGSVPPPPVAEPRKGRQGRGVQHQMSRRRQGGKAAFLLHTCINLLRLYQDEFLSEQCILSDILSIYLSSQRVTPLSLINMYNTIISTYLNRSISFEIK